MSQISLRAYIDYIDDRLNREALREVVAQCRHILEIYPRYVAVYRLLGRALMGQEKYQDALDIFQRVLSADPSDFIAHVGMSDCYRVSGSLEQAVWHLERAFEQIPNNPDLQDAIKELYQEYRGSTPRKIQLTGGALARMYMRGGLYSQAILEVRKALAKDPERLDLQVVLANALWDNHQEIEAGRVAASILKRLPNNIDANRILAVLWLHAEQPREAAAFLDHARQLDPYLGYEIEHQGERAPADAFQLDMMDYAVVRGTTDVGAADWVSQIRAIPKADGVTGPLKAPSPVAASDVFPPSSEAPLVSAPDLKQQMADAPDWLQEALSSPLGREMGQAPPAPVDLDALFEPASTETGVVRTSAEEDFRPRAMDDAAPDWLKDVLGMSGAPAAEEESIPAGSAFTMPGAPSEIAEADTPDWLHDLALGEEAGPAVAPAVENEGWPVTIPGDRATSPTPPPTETEEPDWLAEIKGSAIEPIRSSADRTDASPSVSISGVGGAAPQWLDEILASPPAAEKSEPEEAGIQPPDWLGAAAPKPEVPGPPTPLPDESDTPDWLAEILAEEPRSQSGLTRPAGTRPLAAEEARDVPTWLDEILAGGQPSPAGEGVDEATAPEHKEVSDDWLNEFLGAVPALESEADAGLAGAPPDWLADQFGTPDTTSAGDNSFERKGDLEAWDAPERPNDPLPGEKTDHETGQRSTDLPPFLAERDITAQAEAEPLALDNLSDGFSGDRGLHEQPGASGGEIPDWLKSDAGWLEEDRTEEDDLPDWLKDFQ
jgi:tetratricopeptide (TPR) repeat protein